MDFIIDEGPSLSMTGGRTVAHFKLVWPEQGGAVKRATSKEREPERERAREIELEQARKSQRESQRKRLSPWLSVAFLAHLSGTYSGLWDGTTIVAYSVNFTLQTFKGDLGRQKILLVMSSLTCLLQIL